MFKVNPTTDAETVVHFFAGGTDGADPAAGLINVDGTLYGTTALGGTGTCGCGTVFSITPSGAEKVRYAFKGGSDGAAPEASLIDIKDTLYGTTIGGGGLGGDSVCGGNGCGTVFKFTR